MKTLKARERMKTAGNIVSVIGGLFMMAAIVFVGLQDDVDGALVKSLWSGGLGFILVIAGVVIIEKSER